MLKSKDEMGELIRMMMTTNCPNCDSVEVGCHIPSGVWNCDKCSHEWKEGEAKIWLN